jgi:hypothetical protein
VEVFSIGLHVGDIWDKGALHKKSGTATQLDLKSAIATDAK